MTRQDLKEYRDLKAESVQITEKMKEIEDTLYSLSGVNQDGMPKGSSGENYRVEALIDKKDELKQHYDSLQIRLLEGQYKIEVLIESLPSRERRLMRHYYIDGLTWEKVRVAMHYSWSQVHRIHGSALNHLGI